MFDPRKTPPTVYVCSDGFFIAPLKHYATTADAKANRVSEFFTDESAAHAAGVAMNLRMHAAL